MTTIDELIHHLEAVRKIAGEDMPFKFQDGHQLYNLDTKIERYWSEDKKVYLDILIFVGKNL